MHSKSRAGGGGGGSAKDDASDLLHFSIKDMYAIREIANEKNLFKLIVNSICPGIFGHELVKGARATICWLCKVV